VCDATIHGSHFRFRLDGGQAGSVTVRITPLATPI
jgi:hypothetical protein